MVKCMVKFNTAYQYCHMFPVKAIPSPASHVPVKNLSPPINMMNYLAVSIMDR